ncbi:MAG: NAD-dependent epimerase/dehydratase family protein [Candidatus Tectomicrobia bacterium]|nr:NAD-dependent epimerase/dehydratase family protein [Candidatus Tectomicrobia bacterium]
MHLLVSGGAGFVGSHLVDHLLTAGHQVTVLDNLSTGKAEFLHPKAHFAAGDIREAQVWRSVFNRSTIDAILHFAAQVSVRISVEHPIEDAAINVDGSITMLQAAVEAGVPRCLFASSGGAVYGEQEVLPTTEEAVTEPACPYGIHKLIVERYLSAYGETHGMRWQALRLGNVYGPRQDPYGEAGVVAIFAKAVLEQRRAVINGDGKQSRDFVYVEDVCRAALALLAHPLDGIYNVGTGRETSILDIHRMIGEAAGRAWVPQHGPAKEGEQRHSSVSPARLRHLTGWEPRVSLPEGIRATLAYFQSQAKR